MITLSVDVRTNMAFSDPILVSGNSYARILDGVYRLSTSTADQPQDILIKNTLNPDGVSSYLVEYRLTRNSPTPGAKDDICRVMFQIKYPPKAFTNVEVSQVRDVLVAFLAQPGALDRVLLGER